MDFEAMVLQAFINVSHAFEGDRETRARLYSDYLRFFNKDDLVLDYACGDGAWLELLRDHGINAMGIDYDQGKVNECTSKQLYVIQGDSLNGLIEKPTALTAFHIIEHLQPLDAMRFIMKLNVNKILLITPNIEHPPVQVGFWKDITHVRPYPTCVVEEMCRQAGFTHIESGTQNEDWDTWVYAERPSIKVLGGIYRA